MDVGVFTRSRATLAAWVAGPVLLISALHYTLHVYSRYVDEALERRNTFVKLLPQMAARLQVAHDILDGFGTEAVGESQALDFLGGRVNGAARRHGFMINSLRIEKLAERAADDTPVYQVQVSGEGVLLAVIKFLNEFQGPQSLVNVEAAEIRTARFDAPPVYEGVFKFKCMVMPR
jgi:hypothetical protein